MSFEIPEMPLVERLEMYTKLPTLFVHMHAHLMIISSLGLVTVFGTEQDEISANEAQTQS